MRKCFRVGRRCLITLGLLAAGFTGQPAQVALADPLPDASTTTVVYLPNPDDPDGEQNGTVIAAPTAEDVNALAAKRDFATATLDFERGLADDDDVRAAGELFGQATGIDVMAQVDGILQNPPPDGDSKKLALTQHAQIKSYYCGPGTAYTLLTYLGVSSSAWDGATNVQTVLAMNKYLATGSDSTPSNQRGTGWSAYTSSNPMARTLNRYLYGSSSGYFVADANPGTDYYRDLKFDVDSNVPLALDVLELGGSDANGNPNPHLPGHPQNRTIYHWAVGFGYDSGAAHTWVADPAGQSSAVSWGANVPQTYTYPSKKIIQLVAPRGVVW